ncbi:MAG: hypothetical protein M1817_004056 [Caeruleum heppii]|nr:MAG: hypothetical protein M1817_004056 [Caeruleum heppii]
MKDTNPQQFRDLGQAIYRRIRQVDLTGNAPAEPDWTACRRDEIYWVKQLLSLQEQLNLCRQRSDNLTEHGVIPPQPSDASSLVDDEPPETFYRALPPQPPSPTLDRRRRTTIPRTRRLKRLLRSKPVPGFCRTPRHPRFPLGEGCTSTPHLTDWPVDWTLVYEEHVERLHYQLDPPNACASPNFKNQELEYWQQLSREHSQALLRQFFLSKRADEATVAADQHADVPPSPVSVRTNREAMEDAPISSRLRSKDDWRPG